MKDAGNLCLISYILIVYVALACLFISPPVVFSQASQIEVASSPNLVGSGARALGMGGAFIAVADDATAASWNPGGLIQLERPEISVVGAYFHRSEDNTFGTHPEADGDQRISKTGLNYFSATYPFEFLNRNMIISLNYQNLYDFSRQWDIPYSQTTTDYTMNYTINYKQDGDLSAVGLAYCVQVTPDISLGVTLNIWDDSFSVNNWKADAFYTGTGDHIVLGPFTIDSHAHDAYTFKGVNANFGLLWRLSNSLTMGAVIKTPFEADLNHELRFNYNQYFTDNPAANLEISESYTYSENLDLPLSFGLGLAYRFSDKFTLSGDIYSTRWNDFVLTDSLGNETSPINGMPVGEADIDPAYQIRFGAEYLLIKTNYVIPLRGGIIYDPEPAKGRPDSFFGISGGTGFTAGPFVFDIAYQYRVGNDVRKSMVQNLDFSQDVHEHTLYSSVIYHF